MIMDSQKSKVEITIKRKECYENNYERKIFIVANISPYEAVEPSNSS